MRKFLFADQSVVPPEIDDDDLALEFSDSPAETGVIDHLDRNGVGRTGGGVRQEEKGRQDKPGRAASSAHT
jgi:hypothetical protein